MAVNLTTLFTRLGRFGRMAYVLNQDQAALPAVFASLFAQWNTTDSDQLTQVVLREDALTRAVATAFMPALQQAARDVLTAAVEADQPGQGRSVAAALSEVRRQMIAAGSTVKRCAVGATAAAMTTPAFLGSGAVVLSTVRGDGLPAEHVAPEGLRLTCTQDSYAGGAAAGREQFALAGETNAAGVWDWDYPQGSGAAAGLTAVSADADANASANLLTNGDFETWSQSPLQAENWTITTGAWATNAVQSATALRGSYSLRLPAGATLTSFYQQFGSSAATGAGAGTAAAMRPVQTYAANLWLRTASGTASGGVLTVELVNDAGTVVNDQAGNPNSFTVALAGLTTAWVNRSGTFRLPAVPPATVRLRVRVSTAVAGADVLLDDVCLAPLAPAYPGGFGLAVFAGATPFAAGDAWQITATNDRAGASHLATFQSLFLRLFGDPTFLLPSTAGTPTFADTLITNP